MLTSDTLRQIVIVGASHAGVSAAFKLRELGYTGRLILLGEEAGLPYHRPHLSKQFLRGLVDAESLAQRPQALFAQHAIEYQDAALVEHLDRQAQQVRLSDGRLVDYDALILATGAQLKRLPADTELDTASNVHYLRTLLDAQRLQSALQTGSHLCVVGAGYVGLEVAAVARQHGLKVTVIEQAPRILSRVAGEQTARRLRDLHRSHGVSVLENCRVASMQRQGTAIKSVQLDNGQHLDIDALVVGIGVEPRTMLAQQAGLAVDVGICVDAYARTSDPHVLAIGDCASLMFDGQRVRLESIQNANDMAATAARTLLGQPQAYSPIPWFWSDQYETKLQIAGLNHNHTHVVVRDNGQQSCSIWYYRDEQLLSVDALNDARAFMSAKRWLAAGQSPVAAQIRDHSVSLTDVQWQQH